MEICSIASGSSGNATYIGSEETSLLIDAGISLQRIKKSLSALGKDIEELDGIFFTHEHSDHIHALPKLKNMDIPLYMSPRTYRASKESFSYRPFGMMQSIFVNELFVTPIPTLHDAADPCGFKISDGKKTAGVFTDFGKANDELRQVVREADAMVIESNHDVDMLVKGRYPYHLKERILGDKGHCSNIDAGLVVKENAQNLKHVFLAHLSKNNNTKKIAFETFEKLTGMEPIITDRKEMTEMIRI